MGAQVPLCPNWWTAPWIAEGPSFSVFPSTLYEIEPFKRPLRIKIGFAEPRSRTVIGFSGAHLAPSGSVSIPLK
jgi:hypothetical protein